MKARTLVIAEAGVNHNGSLDRALQLVAVAANAGADVVKFQTYRPESIATRTAEKARYQKNATGSCESQLEMLRKLELTEEMHRCLIDACREHRIEFLSTPFDLESVDSLRDLGVSKWKISSGDITNLPLLQKIGRLVQPVILSTGMANLCEIEGALDVLEAAGTGRASVTVLQCNTEYPTPFDDANLRAMSTIGFAFPGVSVGYSDHTLGFEVAIAAVALGAGVVEKHFTLDRSLSGPDHLSSLEPAELGAMVQAIRNVEQALGTGVKRATLSEAVNRPAARKSIVAAREILAGEILCEKNLAVKRPGTGVSPMRWNEVIGRPAGRDYQRDEMIDA